MTPDSNAWTAAVIVITLAVIAAVLALGSALVG